MRCKVPAGKKPMLETERLVLRPLSADEKDSVHPISNEPNVRLHLWDNEQVSQATVKDPITQSDRMLSEEKIEVFGVRMRGREDLLGFCGSVGLVCYVLGAYLDLAVGSLALRPAILASHPH